MAHALLVIAAMLLVPGVLGNYVSSIVSGGGVFAGRMTPTKRQCASTYSRYSTL